MQYEETDIIMIGVPWMSYTCMQANCKKNSLPGVSTLDDKPSKVHLTDLHRAVARLCRVQTTLWLGGFEYWMSSSHLPTSTDIVLNSGTTGLSPYARSYDMHSSAQ
jgi:hypothetical protein